MQTAAVFPGAPSRAGMYESFYLRAVSPREPVGVWIRHTVHKAPGRRATGSVWCTVFDARRGRPFMHKLTSERLRAPEGSWIAVDDSAIGPGRADGRCGDARWSLGWSGRDAELAHLSPSWLYRAPLPRTKLTSPAPTAVFDGVVALAGRDDLQLAQWPGMVGHNWGSEHAERWIWLHGIGFDGEPDAWLDVALGRVRVGGRLTPWVANGALSSQGRRHRLGGLAARGLQVRESAAGCSLTLPGEKGLRVEVRAEVPGDAAAGWRYANPDGGAHDVVNCSIAAIELTVSPRDGAARTLRSDHAGAYELGMRTMNGTGDRDHGVPIAPFADG
jgi:hypothetical protein